MVRGDGVNAGPCVHKFSHAVDSGAKVRRTRAVRCLQCVLNNAIHFSLVITLGVHEGEEV